MRSASVSAERREWNILSLILKRRTATRDLWSCLKNTGCTDRITADVSFHWLRDGHSPQPKAPDHGVNRNAPGDLYPVHSDIFEAVCSLE